jgi:hypothetical protein
MPPASVSRTVVTTSWVVEGLPCTAGPEVGGAVTVDDVEPDVPLGFRSACRHQVDGLAAHLHPHVDVDMATRSAPGQVHAPHGEQHALMLSAQLSSSGWSPTRFPLSSALIAVMSESSSSKPNTPKLDSIRSGLMDLGMTT